MTHKARGIVLRTTKYGETSIITKLYTDLFGVQTYIIKGVRKSSKKSTGKINYFTPGSILEIEVYKNPLKSLQFIKEYQWGYLYNDLFFNIVKNAIAMYMVELILLSINEEEGNTELFNFFESALVQIDQQPIQQSANFPLTFSLQLAKLLGFQIHGNYSVATPILDLQEGSFVAHKPLHPHFIEGHLAQITSKLARLNDINLTEDLQLNHILRRELLKYYQQYFSLHLGIHTEMKSYSILQTVLE